MIFIPKENEEFFYISDDGDIYKLTNINSNICKHLIKSGNCYCTEKDAIRVRDKSYAEQELLLLADELNGGVEIDWYDDEQNKYYLYYANNFCRFNYHREDKFQSQGTIYCLSPNFLEEALKRLGEEKLKLIFDV